MGIEKYNSFLYGNGLTLAVLNQIKKIFTSPPIDRYLDFNIFFNEFIRAEDHKRILRDFNKYFELNKDTIKTHLEIRNFICQRSDEIQKIGFERWVGKYLFVKDQVPKNVIIYLYVLYNYWYHLIHQNILTKFEVVELLQKIGDLIKQKIEINKNIYTLNFDTILDEYLNPQHLHGVFALPLKDIKELFLNFYDENEVEYIYLFGSNGEEKRSRLDKIRSFKQNRYDLDRLYGKDINLGHLLIYGISFGNTEFITPAFLEKYPNHVNEYYFRSVDGHILLRLNQLYGDAKIEKITISYYSQDDLVNYKNIIRFTDFEPIVKYKQCDEIFNFNKLNKNTV
ncbi:MAG: hypothetical protein JSW62_00840 [Thermoplasmatales archaeon]|nr:MAG: hypothetical protein JSW62_00840 [Thermoplasmatales archaeon]